MRIQSYKNTFSLKPAEIDAFSDQLEASLISIQAERKNRIRIRLSMEEALLRLKDNYGEEAQVTAVIDSRLGSSFIQIELEGAPYNPLSQEDTELDDWNSSLLTAIGLSPRYSYSGRKNSLRLTLPSKKINPVLKIILAILIGTLAGIWGDTLLSPETSDFLYNTFLDPLYEMWNRILNVLSGPVIFFMVLTTILNAYKITEKGGNSQHTLLRYFVFSICIAVLTILLGASVFSFSLDNIVMNTGEVEEIVRKLFHLIPNEFFSPFMASNTPQLLTMAAVIGNVLNRIGSPAEDLKRNIRQINMIGLTLADWVSRLVPFFVSTLIIHEVWRKSIEVFTDTLWVCLFLSLIASIVCILAFTGYICIKYHTPVWLLMKKLWSPFAMTIRSGSLNESFGETRQCCIHRLGINNDFTAMSLPYGLVLFMPVSVIGTMVFIIYAAMQFHVDISVLWLVTAAVLGVVLFVATPPVPGANLLAYIAIFTQLGIPKDALIAAMIFDVLFGLFACAANQTMLQMELILQADRIGLLNRESLNRSFFSFKSDK